jgi:hypothetical protein
MKSLKSFLFKNFGLKLISILIALILWLLSKGYLAKILYL